MVRILKKLFLVGGLTLIGHVFALLLYPISTRHLPPEEVVSIGIIDSTVMLLIGCLGFGLNVTATRDIALSSNLKDILKNVQSSRITLSLICSALGLLWIIFDIGRLEVGALLVAAPVFALNYDFALYGAGKPEWAAIISVIRQAFPLAIFLLAVILDTGKSEYYLLLLLIFTLTSSFFVSKVLKSPLLYFPSILFYKGYADAFLVGIASIFLVFQRYGFLNMIEPRLSNEEFIYLATCLKVLLFISGCKRMLIQVFYTRLIDDSFCTKLNIFCCFISCVFLAICWQVPHVISQILFDNKNGSDFVILIALGTCSLLLFAASDAQLLLKYRDNWVFYSNLISSGIFAVIIYFGVNYMNSALDYLYLLVSVELLLAILYMSSLHMSKISALRKHNES